MTSTMQSQPYCPTALAAAASVHEQAGGTQACRHQRQHQTQHVPAARAVHCRAIDYHQHKDCLSLECIGATRSHSTQAAANCRATLPPAERCFQVPAPVKTAHLTVSFLLCSIAALSEFTSLSICVEHKNVAILGTPQAVVQVCMYGKWSAVSHGARQQKP